MDSYLALHHLRVHPRGRSVTHRPARALARNPRTHPRSRCAPGTTGPETTATTISVLGNSGSATISTFRPSWGDSLKTRDPGRIELIRWLSRTRGLRSR